MFATDSICVRGFRETPLQDVSHSFFYLVSVREDSTDAFI